MTDFNYPPTAEFEFGTERDTIAERLDSDELDEADEARLESRKKALDWAIGEFGPDAAVELQGLTATQRSRTVDTARRRTVGEMGGDELTNWIITAQIRAAPWLNPDDDLPTRAQVTGQLPPALVDWLDSKAEDLNSLSEGN